jgi:hypothetical protein
MTNKRRCGMTNKGSGNSKNNGKDEMRGFFATLRMTIFFMAGKFKR